MKKFRWQIVAWMFGVGVHGGMGVAGAQTAVAPPAVPTDIKNLDNADTFDGVATNFLDFYNLDDLNKAIAKSPDKATPYDDRGAFYLGKKLYDKALADCKKAVELDPKLLSAHENLARIYRERKEVANALLEYGKAIALEAPGTYNLGQRGNYLAELGRNNEALADYNKEIELAPEEEDGYFWRADLYAQLHQYDKALLDYNKLIELDPKDANYHLLHARNLSNLKRFDDAIASYSTALELNPKSTVAWNELGLAYWQTKSYDLAEEKFARALTLADGNTAGYIRLNRARMHYEQEKRGAALEDLNAVIEQETKARTQAKGALIDTSLAQAYFYRSLINGRGISLISTDSDKAPIIADATRAVQLDPSLAPEYLNRDRTLLGNFNARYTIVVLLYGAVAAIPNDIPTLLKLGDAQQNVFKSRDAIATYTRALALSPQSAQALKSRATAYGNAATPYESAQWLPAIADWKRYLAHAATDTEGWQKLGNAQYNAGQTAEGVATFRQMIKTNPDNALAHLMLALGLAISGQGDDAKSEVKIYIEIATDKEKQEAISAFGNATTHYPDNAAVKAIYDLIPDKTVPVNDGDNIPFFV
ncbi:hypothetical protein IAD21_01060 [Abditibacteriota bacterium]|nr:hypothetical protein IAD21_01060 [Abditibacteriota bacterium]